MHVYDTNKSHQYEMIMGRELIKELGIDINFSDCTITGKLPGPFGGYYTPMKDFKEVIDTDFNNEIISDEIYDGEPVKGMNKRATHITSANSHKTDLEKEAEICTHLGK